MAAPGVGIRRHRALHVGFRILQFLLPNQGFAQRKQCGNMLGIEF